MTKAVIISARPIRMPGSIPAANRPPTEMSRWAPMMIITVEGGMMAPMIELDAVTAAENALP